MEKSHKVTLEINSTVPAFSVVDDNRNIVTEQDLTSRFTVLYFYPKDDTPGCTTEATGFSALYDEFTALDTEIYGISRDSIESHLKFREKYGLQIRLLSDPTLAMHKAFGAFGPKVSYGKTVEGVIRSTFIINNSLKVLYANYAVVTKGHAELILNKVKTLHS